jgi:hypothetical protein
MLGVVVVGNVLGGSGIGWTNVTTITGVSLRVSSPAAQIAAPGVGTLLSVLWLVQSPARVLRAVPAAP